MSIGPKIKEYRVKAGLTQKELADKLFVTYQAVSRWENDDAEPSISTLKEICRILNCTTDELFEIENKEKENIEVIEKVVVQEVKQVLALCEECNTPIYNQNDINRINSNDGVKNKILCPKCNEKRIEKEKQLEEIKEKNKQEQVLKRRVHSFVWPSIVSIIFIIFAIVCFANNSVDSGLIYLAIAVLAYTFLATMILNNTFITDMWLEISSWGFIKLPGIIFEFSFDGLIFLIITKIILFILAISLALLAASFATVIAMALSIFVYPFALRRNFKGILSLD